MAKKVAVITGATSGIGEVGARAIAAAGYDLILPCRNLGKGRALKASIQSETPDTLVELIECNLASLESVKVCAIQIRNRHQSIDLLINNAGTAEMQQQMTVDGIERTFAINHLAHFVLTLQLLPLLKAAPKARIVNTASEANYQGKADFLDDINFGKRPYRVFQAYANSKLANVLFTNKLARELKGTNITANCFHPGRVATNIWPETKWYLKLAVKLLKRFYLISPERGAKPMLKLALDPSLEDTSGVFYFEMKPRKPKTAALDESLQDKLWDISESLAGKYLN